jgi:hypothetical protein
MNNKLIPSLFMVCAITSSHAALPTKEEMVLILREESQSKLEAFQKIMPTLLQESKVTLGEMAYGYVVLADVMQFPEAQQLVGWPFMQFLCPRGQGRRFTEEGICLRCTQDTMTDGGNEERICYIDSTEIINLVSPCQPDIWYLSHGDLIDKNKKNWGIAAWSLTEEGNYSQYEKHFKDMGFLAEIYVELLTHPDAINNFLALISSEEGISFIAYPKDMKLIKEDETLNEEFFIKWHNNILEYFAGHSREYILLKKTIKALSPENKGIIKGFFQSLNSGGTQNVGEALLNFLSMIEARQERRQRQ